MRLFSLAILLFSSNLFFAQYSEELVEILYETDELTSIKILPDVPYVSQMLGGVVVNTDDNYYTFTGAGGDTKLYTLDIATGDLLYQVDVPQIQMIQYNGSDELIGIAKGNPSNLVSLTRYNYKNGIANNFPPIQELEGVAISTHNSAIDIERSIFYFVGSKPGSSNWNVFAININDGTLLQTIEITPEGEALMAIAFDKEKNKLIGLLGVTPGAKSLVELDPVTETISEINKIDEIHGTFGGHRYWAYDDDNNKFFIIGFDSMNESHLYVIEGNTGDVLFQNPYDDEAWIMEEHSPLELRYSPNTGQLLGIRKGSPLVTVGNITLEEERNNLKIYPNPSSEQISIKVLANDLIRNIQLQDIYGNIVYRKKAIGENIVQLEIDQLASGVYYVWVESERNIWHQKLIKH